MSRFTDLAGPAPDPLPGFPGVFVRHGTLMMHRELGLVLQRGQGVAAADEAAVARRLHGVQKQLEEGALGPSAQADLVDELTDIRLAVGSLNDMRQFERDQVLEEDRCVLQHLFDGWLVDEGGQAFSDVSGPDPEKDVAEVAAGTIISATLALLRRRQEGNGEAAGTS